MSNILTNMHRKILKEASESQAKDFLDQVIIMVKETNQELYEKIEESLYVEVYGCHFTERLLKEANESMVNEDGTKGGHWTLEQTTDLASRKNVTFTHFNKYDFNYVMNMIYSDYYGVVSDDINTYFNLAMKFLCDKDAKEGKPLNYFLKIVK